MRILCLIVLLLSGCATLRHSPARYDLGTPKSGGGPPLALTLATIEVRSPSWLETPLMQYRLAYAQDTRREAYADSRWVAPPAELVELALQRRLLTGGAPAPGCRLVVELDEFVQAFDRPGESQALLEARAMLLSPRGGSLLARQRFSERQPAGADAGSGVAALSITTARLGSDLGTWLDRAADSPGIAARCRGS